MSRKYNTVKKYYAKGLWSGRMVRNAVVKEWITESEFEEITGSAYNVTLEEVDADE